MTPQRPENPKCQKLPKSWFFWLPNPLTWIYTQKLYVCVCVGGGGGGEATKKVNLGRFINFVPKMPKTTIVIFNLGSKWPHNDQKNPKVAKKLIFSDRPTP